MPAVPTVTLTDQQTWYQWVGTTTQITNYQPIWGTWVAQRDQLYGAYNGGTGGVTITRDCAWQAWQTIPLTDYQPMQVAMEYTNTAWTTWVDEASYYRPEPLTAEQAEAQRLALEQMYAQEATRRAQRQVEAEESIRIRAAARARAHELFMHMLDEEQRAELEKDKKFHVTGSRGRRYCIETGRDSQSGNVHLLDDAGNVQTSFCAHPRGYLPNEDAWLAQALHLEADEESFIKVANVTRGVRPAPLAPVEPLHLADELVLAA